MTLTQPSMQTGTLSSSNSKMGSKMVNKIKGYRVLGDYQEYEVKLAEVTVPPPPPAPDTVDNTDPVAFPSDVWSAATISPDRGAAIIRAYRDVLQTRNQYQSQLSNIHTIRQAKLAALSNPMAGPPGSLPSAGKTFGSQKGGLTTQQLRARGVLPALATATLMPSIEEAVKEGLEPRRLELFNQAEQKWAAAAGSLADHTKRPQFDLAMQRGPEWRAKCEALEALERAIPITERIGGDDAWHMSLRDAWERIVPVGNMFSGLCSVIRDKPSDRPLEQFARVGRPLDPPMQSMQSLGLGTTLFATAQSLKPLPPRGSRGSAGAGGGLNSRGVDAGSMGGVGGASFDAGSALGFGPGGVGSGAVGTWGGGKTAGRSLTLRGRDWQSSDWLKTQTQLYAKNIRRLFPNDPDMGSLALKGQSLEHQLEDLAFSPISLQEVEQHMAVTDHPAYEAYMEVKQRLEDERRAALAEVEAAQAAAEAAAKLAGPQPGPHLELSTPHVQLLTSFSAAARGGGGGGASTAPSPSTAFATFSLRNRGTAVVYYTWSRRPVQLAPFSAAAGAEPPSALSLSRTSGAILPGGAEEFTVVFTAPAPGLYSQEWVLASEPQLSVWPPLALTARGMCLPEEPSRKECNALDETLHEAEKTRKVRAALERVLANVHAPPAPRPPPQSPEQEAECSAFERGNAEASPPVFYNPQQHAQLAATYGEAVEKLRAATVPPPEDPAATKKKSAKDTKKGAAAEPPPPPVPAVPAFPDAWDSSLPTLRILLGHLHKCAAPGTPLEQQQQQPVGAEAEAEAGGPWAAMAAELSARVDAAVVAMHVPPDGHVLLRYAANRMLRTVTETVAAKIQAVQADYDLRRAEQAARQQEVGGVDERWRLDKSRAGVKTVLKAGLVPGLVEESSRALAAAGDALELRLRALDAEAEAAGAAGDGEALEAAQWRRFELLRTWVRLGIPPRPPYIC